MFGVYLYGVGRISDGACVVCVYCRRMFDDDVCVLMSEDFLTVCVWVWMCEELFFDVVCVCGRCVVCVCGMCG